MNNEGFALMEALIGLLLLSLVATIVLPLLVTIYEDKRALQQEQDLLLHLEEKRYAYDMASDQDGWHASEVTGVLKYCKQSPLHKRVHCVYVKEQ
ncbi:hypothetical protein NSQ26_08425 [Bacillus sp. FSL W7-1360]